MAEGIILERAIVKVGSLDRPEINPHSGEHYSAGDLRLLVFGDVRNDTDEVLYVDFWAEGFDSGGRQATA